MVRLKGSKGTGKASSKNLKGKKRKSESALEQETGEDEFFLASDQEENEVGDDEALEETAEQKRLRLGMPIMKAVHINQMGSVFRLRRFLTCEAMRLQPKHTSHACARASLWEVGASSHCPKLLTVLLKSVMQVHVHICAPRL